MLFVEFFAVDHVNSSGYVVVGLAILAPVNIKYVTLFILTLLM